MKKDNSSENNVNRRQVLNMATAAAATAAVASSTGFVEAFAKDTRERPANFFSPGAFVYTEVQVSVPFDKGPWRRLNPILKRQPGLLNKTWLAGVGNNSVGGIYAFDTIENAQKFVTGYFPQEAKSLDAAHTTRVFNGSLVKDASSDMKSAHFGHKMTGEPGAFVYTELQANIPFAQYPWKERNPIIKKQKGLVSKTWMSGLNTNTVGGFYVFDTMENAKNFALTDFPKVGAKLNAAFYTRLFHGPEVKEASSFLNSVHFS